jgi:UDP-2,4-diacetamido-2,4,6-trideoxy-beta-L-altropyranose hydrolase
LNIIQENKQINRSHHVEIPQPRQKSRLHYGDSHIDRLSKNANLSCKFYIYYEFEREDVNFVFKANSSSLIGSGHFIRCLNLALNLKELGNYIYFIFEELLEDHQDLLDVNKIPNRQILLLGQESAIQLEMEQILAFRNYLEINEIDWFIVDDYKTNDQWDEEVKRICKYLLVIEDLHFFKRNCNILLDMNLRPNNSLESRIQEPDGRVRLIGPTYALLDSRYTNLHAVALSQNDIHQHIALVYFGSIDKNSLTLRTSQILIQNFPEIKLKAVILGNNIDYFELEKLSHVYPERFQLVVDPKFLGDEMLGCTFSIGSGGISLWERFALGIVPITTSTAENQKEILESLGESKFLIYLGESAYITDSEIQSTVSTLLSDSQLFRNYRSRILNLVDGRGIQRVSFEILDYSNA